MLHTKENIKIYEIILSESENLDEISFYCREKECDGFCPGILQKHRTDIISKIGEIDFIAVAGHICRYLEPDEYPR